VDLVSTAKIMDILLTGALRNMLIDMKRRLNRDIISKPMPKKHLNQMEKNIKRMCMRTQSMTQDS
jgi:hypothetical protein